MATTTRSKEESFTNKPYDMGETAKQFGEKAKDAAGNVAEKAKETASGAFDKAREVASNVADRTMETASSLGQKAQDATHAVGKGIGSLGSTVRENLPQSGILGTAASTVAEGLECTGHYLEKEGLQGMVTDLTNVIRRNPLPALLVGIGLGFVIARATASRNS